MSCCDKKHSSWADYMQAHGKEEYEAWDKAVAAEVAKGHTPECATFNLACAPWDTECICEKHKDS